MADSWEGAIEALQQADAGLSRLDPRDFTSLAGLLEERQAAIERIAALAAQAPGAAGAECVQRLTASAAAGAALSNRLLVERAGLREDMAASQHRRSLSRALAPHPPCSGSRLRYSG
jgi:hypothetical protein